MPHGVVARFDLDTGEGRVVDRGRRYVCRAGDMAAAAREVGVRVHFDVGSDGVTATRVVPDHGSTGVRHVPAEEVAAYSADRVERRDRRAPHDPGRRVTGPVSELDLRPVVRPTPMRLATWWTASIGAGDLDDAVSVFAPDGVLHLDGNDVKGERRLRTVIEGLGVFGTGRAPDTMIGDDGDILAEWRSLAGSAATTARLRFVAGELAEAWIDTDLGAPADSISPPENVVPFPLQVVCHGRESGLRRAEAVEKVSRALEVVREPILFVRLKLTTLRDPAASRPAIAEVAVDINGDLVRAHASADDLRDAVDRLDARLRDRLHHRHERRTARRRTSLQADDGHWRHGSAPAERSPHFDRPSADREVVRHKTWSGATVSVDEAVEDLESLDHDFHLFRDEATGSDCLLLRTSPDTYELESITTDATQVVEGATAEVVASRRVVTELGLRAAIEELDLSGEPLVFFRDESTRRGNVVYRRMDGHYGLISPAD